MAVTRPSRSHAQHDAYLVAQFAAGDVTATERAVVERLVASCDRCRALRDDLLAIVSAAADLPAPPRTRDFRLSPDDAARLRSGWRRWLGRLATPRFAFTQPLGAALATLGLAGLLIGVLPPGLVGSGATSAPISAPTSAPTAGEPAALRQASPAAGSAEAGEPSASLDKSASGSPPAPRATNVPPTTSFASAAPSAAEAVPGAAPASETAPATGAADGATAASSDQPGASSSALSALAPSASASGEAATVARSSPAATAVPTAVPGAVPGAEPAAAPTAAGGVSGGAPVNAASPTAAPAQSLDGGQPTDGAPPTDGGQDSASGPSPAADTDARAGPGASSAGTTDAAPSRLTTVPTGTRTSPDGSGGPSALVALSIGFLLAGVLLLGARRMALAVSRG